MVLNVRLEENAAGTNPQKLWGYNPSFIDQSTNTWPRVCFDLVTSVLLFYYFWKSLCLTEKNERKRIQMIYQKTSQTFFIANRIGISKFGFWDLNIFIFHTEWLLNFDWILPKFHMCGTVEKIFSAKLLRCVVLCEVFCYSLKK